jgi:hypothetical protein
MCIYVLLSVLLAHRFAPHGLQKAKSVHVCTFRTYVIFISSTHFIFYVAIYRCPWHRQIYPSLINSSSVSYDAVNYRSRYLVLDYWRSMHVYDQ